MTTTTTSSAQTPQQPQQPADGNADKKSIAAANKQPAHTSNHLDASDLNKVGSLHYDGAVYDNDKYSVKSRLVEANQSEADELTKKLTQLHHVATHLDEMLTPESINNAGSSGGTTTSPSPSTESRSSAQDAKSAAVNKPTPLKVDDDDNQPEIAALSQQLQYLPLNPQEQYTAAPQQSHFDGASLYNPQTPHQYPAYAHPSAQQFYSPVSTPLSAAAPVYPFMSQPPANALNAPQAVQAPGHSNESLHAVAHLIRDNNNVVIKFLPVSFTQDSLYQLCSAFGDILSCRLIRDRNTGVSLGYGFVTFGDDHAASQAVNALNGLPIENKILRAAIARPITPAQVTTQNGMQINPYGAAMSSNITSAAHKAMKANIYIAGLPRHYTVEDLNALFAPYGTINESRILLDREGLSRGVGFVRYLDPESAAISIQQLNGTAVPGSDEALIVRLARDSNNIGPSGSLGTAMSYPRDSYRSQPGSNRASYDQVNSPFTPMYPPQVAYGANQLLSPLPPAANAGGAFKHPYTQQHAGHPTNGGASIFQFPAPPRSEPSAGSGPGSATLAPIEAGANASPYFPQSVQSPTFSTGFPNTPTSALATAVAQAATMTPVPTPTAAQAGQMRGAAPYGQHNFHSFHHTNNAVPLQAQHRQRSGQAGSPLEGQPGVEDQELGAGESPRLEARRSFERSGVSLFVFHLPPDITDGELQQLFSSAGPVLSAKVMMDSDGTQSKGFGFVNFATVQAAEHAITVFNGRKLGSKFLKVSFKRSQQPAYDGQSGRRSV